MRIVDETENGPAWQPHSGRDDAPTNFGGGAVHRCTGGQCRRHRLGYVGDSPVRQRTIGGRGIREQTKFVPGDIESDVERLAKVGLRAEEFAEPRRVGGPSAVGDR